MAKTRETASHLAKKEQLPGEQHPGEQHLNDSVFQLQADLGRQSSPADLLSTEHTADHQDGGYGWLCVATCFTVNSFTWGVVAVRLSLLSGKHLD